MRRLSVFNNVSLDGYLSDENGDMSWAHKQDAEWGSFAAENASRGGVLVLGRITYDLMASFWPTPLARESAPALAERMNRLSKVVFSRTLETASWENTKVVKGDIAVEMRKMKSEPGPDMVILGSGTIISQLTDARLIDEYQVVVNAIVLGRGRKMFDGVREKMGLTLKKTRAFSNGNVVLSYEPTR